MRLETKNVYWKRWIQIGNKKWNWKKLRWVGWKHIRIRHGYWWVVRILGPTFLGSIRGLDFRSGFWLRLEPGPVRSTPGFDLKPEIGCFSKTGSSKNRNRKKMCLMKREYNSVVQVLVFWSFDQGRRYRLFKTFAPYVLVNGHTRTKRILAADKLENSNKSKMTLITKTHELSDEILFDFRMRCFQLLVSEKQLTSGLRSKPEVKKLTMQKLKVNCISRTLRSRGINLKKRDLKTVKFTSDRKFPISKDCFQCSFSFFRSTFNVFNLFFLISNSWPGIHWHDRSRTEM